MSGGRCLFEVTLNKKSIRQLQRDTKQLQRDLKETQNDLEVTRTDHKEAHRDNTETQKHHTETEKNFKDTQNYKETQHDLKETLKDLKGTQKDPKRHKRTSKRHKTTTLKMRNPWWQCQPAFSCDQTVGWIDLTFSKDLHGLHGHNVQNYRSQVRSSRPGLSWSLTFQLFFDDAFLGRRLTPWKILCVVS